MPTTLRPSRSKDRPLWARNLEQHVISIWDTARREGHTHAQILARYAAEVAGSPRFAQLSGVERACIFATFLACSEMANRRDLEWRLGPSTGPLPLPHVWGEGSALSQLARTPGALYGAHFWRGTDKAFTDYLPCDRPA